MKSPYRLIASTRFGVFSCGAVAGAVMLLAGMMMAQALTAKGSQHHYNPKVITDRIVPS
ncbi:hypothetical protein [Rhodoligotrophos defluvii]|uniref:hypothetical protein n=1 Tax=Rhodoligotrophos defluvii TaxID=2561934 RepID=UPI0014851F5F|nr:hypothetical protein [Rhodoligotrophos defluvii]